MTWAGNVGFSLGIDRRDGVLIGHRQDRWCTDWTKVSETVLTVHGQ